MEGGSLSRSAELGGYPRRAAAGSSEWRQRDTPHKPGKPSRSRRQRIRRPRRRRRQASLAQQSIKNGHFPARAAAIRESRGEGSNQPKCASVRQGDVQIQQNLDAAGPLAGSHPDAPQDDFLGGKGISPLSPFLHGNPDRTPMGGRGKEGELPLFMGALEFLTAAAAAREKTSLLLPPSIR